MGDITHIYNASGTVVGTYRYNAWGMCTIGTNTNSIATLNPFRYRGYYWDNETGLYYLQSRYYDPIVCRFINADSVSYLDPESINGLNLYAYCGNNPVNMIDSTGTFALSLLLIGFFVGAAVGFGTSVVTQGISEGWDNINWGQAAFDGLIWTQGDGVKGHR